MTRVSGNIIGAAIGTLILWVAKTIFGLKIEEFWDQKAQPFVEAHIGAWAATMLEYVPTFWGGVAVTLLIVALIDQVRCRLQKVAIRSTDNGQDLGESSPPDEQNIQPPEITIEQQARDDLELFVTDHLLRTCDALIHLQSEFIRRAKMKEPFSTIAIDGLLGRWELRDFDEGLRAMSGFGDSPPCVPSAGELVGGVDKIEKGYPVLCKQGQDIATAIGAKFGEDERLDAIYEEWRKSHNATVEAYEKVKRDPRMRRDEILRKLHRPVRQTRFGSRIPLPQADEKFAIYTP